MYILSNTVDASNFVNGVDKAFLFIMGVSFIFLIGLTFTMLYFIFRYNKKKNPQATQIKGSTKLEIIWTVIPTLLVLVMFYYGWSAWTPMRRPPKDTFDVTITGRMWNFTFQYENGKKSDTLIVPINKAIKMKLVSMDVIHGFYIPAFRIKEDVVPGREKMAWFIPQREGYYELFCSEYCGLNHSYMYNYVKVIPEDQFNAWYADTVKRADVAAVDSPTATGKRIMKNIGCFACHTVDGTKLVGPSFKGIYGHKVTVEKGGSEQEITVDDEYIKRSIYEPNAEIVKGYNKGLMQPYTGQLSEDDIKQIIEYLKTLQ